MPQLTQLVDENSEQEDGRRAAHRLCDEWPNTDWVPEQPSPTWARAAIRTFADIIREQKSIFKASQQGTEILASMLSPRLFQGLLEGIQNADDLGASEIRIVLQRVPRRELLIVHNGKPVSLAHVGAMVLPSLSTKADDVDASGRFGIGQKTLKALGGPLEMHCAPFNFIMHDEAPELTEPRPPILHVYQPEMRDTMLVVPLDPRVNESDLYGVVDALGVQSLLFLRSLRRLSFLDIEKPEANRNFGVNPKSQTSVEVEFDGELLTVQFDVIKVTAPNEKVGTSYQRYWMNRPLKPTEFRLNKATGETTPLGICICSDPRESGALHDRVPLPVKTNSPISLNAQFDPDGARSTVLETTWNAARFADLGELLGAIALETFGRDPCSAWAHVPLESEGIDADDFVTSQFRKAVVESCHNRLVNDLRLPTRSGSMPLAEIVYEEESLEGLVSDSDLELLESDHDALAIDYRDQNGRWRKVLDELGQSLSLGLEEALEIFQIEDQVAARDPTWFVSMAALAIEQDLWSEFAEKKSIRLADGRMVACPTEYEPRVLVRTDSPQSLAGRLGLSLPVHDVYLTKTQQAEAVDRKLSETKALWETCDLATDALQLLSRSDRPTGVSVRLEDDELLALRDAWAQLPKDQQRDMGAKIGANIELRTVTYTTSSKRVPIAGWARPIDAYLPSTIDRERDSFAKAAARTPGLVWVDPTYAKLLRHERRRGAAGALRFLAALGAARDPRLVIPTNEEVKWARDKQPASPISGVIRPDAQLKAIQAGSYSTTHLLHDRWSPDLDAVVKDIQSATPKTRRKRALALLSVLSRGWDKRFNEFQTAKAVYGYKGYWTDPHDVQATWLARLAATAWLPNGRGTLKVPSDLAIPSDANRLIYGSKQSAYLAKIENPVPRIELLQALGVRLGPSAEDLVGMLGQLSEKRITTAVVNEANTIYQLLATDLKSNAADTTAGRGMTPSRLRNLFRGSTGQDGLLLADGQWRSPETVFRGPRIFGDYRAFAPHISGLDPLWAALKISEPDIRDCVNVLREIARSRTLSASAKGVTLRTLRALESGVHEASPQLLASLKSIPLWNGENWSVSRPIYALNGEALASADIPELEIWRPGLRNYSEIESLLPFLGVSLLSLEDFALESLSAAGLVEGESKRVHFAQAVSLLKEELIRNDLDLCDSLTCTWEELMRAQIVIDPALGLTFQPGKGSLVRFDARAHMMHDPLTFIVRSMDDLEQADAGGQAVASLFQGDRQKLAWAWSSVWRKALAGEQAREIILPSTKFEEMNVTERLTDLQSQAEARSAGRSKATSPNRGKSQNKKVTPVQVRQLRDPDELAPTRGTIVNRGASSDGTIFVKPRRKGQSGRKFNGSPSETPSRTEPKARTVLPPTSDREQLALEAVKRALRLDDDQIQDVRAKRGIGVDAIDEMRQCYEIKMSSGPDFPSDVTLTANEVEAAQSDPDFFLAIVAGLEAGEGSLKVRFIFRPLEQLAAKIKGEVTLGGADKAEALEYEFFPPK